jgi:hypothetical protein
MSDLPPRPDHPVNSIPPATEDYWADKPPSERPAKPQKSNVPEANPHTSDPWNKAFKD